jgi:anti-sigma B factor antagonist
MWVVRLQMAAGRPALVSTGVPGEPESDGPEIYERDDDGIRVIGARGDLDLGAAAEFCARVDAARTAGTRRLLLDLTQLRACDASGLRALLGAAAEVAASAGRVALVPPDEGPAARLFALTGAAEFLPLHPTVADAQRLLLSAHGYAGSG